MDYIAVLGVALVFAVIAETLWRRAVRIWKGAANERRQRE